MASTRNNNTPEDYCLQQRGVNAVRRYGEYKFGAAGMAFNPVIPCVGYTPSHMPASFFSNNPVEIESRLFGIGANNLVRPQSCLRPSLKSIPFKSFFKRPTYVPEPCYSRDTAQRPFVIP